MNAPVQYRRQGVDERRASRGRPHETSGRVGGGGVRHGPKPQGGAAPPVRRTHPLASDASGTDCRDSPVSESTHETHR